MILISFRPPYYTTNSANCVLGSILSLLLATVIVGCKSSVETSLINKVNQKCDNQARLKCQIALKDATPFTWDKLYLFGAWTTSDAIKKTIGLDYHGEDVQDDYRRMLFVKGNKVVYEEELQPFDYQHSLVDFSEIIDSLSQAKKPFFTPESALFVVDKGKIEYSCKDCFFYSLSVLSTAH